MTSRTEGYSEVGILRHIASLLRDRKARDRLLKHARNIEKAPRELRPVLLTAVALAEPALSHLAPLDPASLPAYTPYPDIPPEIAGLIISGMRPVDIVPGFTRREAHEWLLAGAPHPGGWIIGRRCPMCPILSAIDDLRVALWLTDRWKSAKQRDALVRPRQTRLFGHDVEGAFIDRIDELRPSDLRTSVEATFKQAAKRMQRNYERLLRSKGEPLSPVPDWWEPVPYVRLLNTGPDLVAEGRAMRHCVADYADKIRRQQSLILGIFVEGSRSTVELDRDTLRVLQHKGPGNVTPHPLNIQVLEHYLPIWRQAAGLETISANPYWAAPAVDLGWAYQR